MIELEYTDLPLSIQAKVNSFDQEDNFTYENCKELLNDCEELGYTFDYGLDAVPFNFRKL